MVQFIDISYGFSKIPICFMQIFGRFQLHNVIHWRNSSAARVRHSNNWRFLKSDKQNAADRKYLTLQKQFMLQNVATAICF